MRFRSRCGLGLQSAKGLSELEDQLPGNLIWLLTEELISLPPDPLHGLLECPQHGGWLPPKQVILKSNEEAVELFMTLSW